MSIRIIEDFLLNNLDRDNSVPTELPLLTNSQLMFKLTGLESRLWIHVESNLTSSSGVKRKSSNRPKRIKQKTSKRNGTPTGASQLAAKSLVTEQPTEVLLSPPNEMKSKA